MPEITTSINLDEHLACGGPAAHSFLLLWESLWHQEHIPPELLELCRLTFARLHQDQLEQSAVNPFVDGSGKDAYLREVISEGRAFDSGNIPSHWKSALLFAEYYWTDVQTIPDEIANEVKLNFGDPGFVLLIEALGCIDARIRAARCLRNLSAYSSMKEVSHVG